MPLFTMLNERFSIWRAIFARPWVVVFGSIYGVIGLLDFVRAKVLPVEYHCIWDSYYVMPDLSLHTWLMIGLVVSVVILLEGSYRLIKQRDIEHLAVLTSLRSELLEAQQRMDTPLSLDYQAVEKLAKQGAEIANLKAQLAPRSLSSDQSDKLFRFFAEARYCPSIWV